MSFDDVDRLLGEPSRKTEDSKKKRSSVLVIDDDEHVLRALRMVLSRFYDVTLATSAEQGLRAISPEHAAVILDIRMPVHDGFWACDRIRERFPDIPVIFHTAHQDLKSAGAVEAEHKPFAYLFKDGDIARLVSTVAAAVESRRPTGAA